MAVEMPKVRSSVYSICRSYFDFHVLSTPVIIAAWLLGGDSNETKETQAKRLQLLVIFSCVGFVATLWSKILQIGSLQTLALFVSTMTRWGLLCEASNRVTFKLGFYVPILVSFFISVAVLLWERLGRVKEDDTNPTWIKFFVKNIKPLVDNVISKVNVEEALLNDIERQKSSSSLETKADSQPVTSDNDSQTELNDETDKELNDETLDFFYKNLEEVVSNGCIFMRWVTLGIFGIGTKAKIFKGATQIYVHLVAYAVIGCICFNMASRMKKNVWYVVLVCVACSMQTGIWEQTLIHFFWSAWFMPWIVLIGSIIVSGPLVYWKYSRIKTRSRALAKQQLQLQNIELQLS